MYHQLACFLVQELQEARRAGIRTLAEADAHATESRAKRPASAQLPAAELMTPAPRLSSLGEKSRSSLSRSISALDGVAAAMLQVRYAAQQGLCPYTIIEYLEHVHYCRCQDNLSWHE